MVTVADAAAAAALRSDGAAHQPIAISASSATSTAAASRSARQPPGRTRIER
ncbi:hypothetical protein [Nocardia alni]|uniref:hypothetical protein n=1 Tax=Nocardia alni TaxID=2815723 RepID=UPI001C24ED10|nr:hypothetical protein [Nocardia alni]